MRAFDFRQIGKGCLVGTFDLELPSGLILCQCTLFEKDGKRWVAGPSKKLGEKYLKCVDFTSREVAEKFSAVAMKALDTHLAVTK